MKTLILILCFLSGIQVPCRADLGSQVLHKAKFVMKDGTAKVAFVLMWDFQESMCDPCSISRDQAFQKYLVDHFYKNRLVDKTLNIKLYEQVYFRTVRHFPSGGYTELAFADSTSIHSAHLDSIKYTVYLGVEKRAGPYTQVQLFDKETMINLKSVDWTSIGKRTTQHLVYEQETERVSTLIITITADTKPALSKQIRKELSDLSKKHSKRNISLYQPVISKYAELGVVIFMVFSNEC
jgi:hypothetical protein